MLVVPHPSPVHSSADYVLPGHMPRDGSVQRILRMRLAELHRHIVVDVEDSSVPARDPKSNIGDSPSGSDCGSDSGSGSGSDAADGDATSSAITVSNTDPKAAAPAPPPQKQFRGTAL